MNAYGIPTTGRPTHPDAYVSLLGCETCVICDELLATFATVCTGHEVAASVDTLAMARDEFAHRASLAADAYESDRVAALAAGLMADESGRTGRAPLAATAAVELAELVAAVGDTFTTVTHHGPAVTGQSIGGLIDGRHTVATVAELAARWAVAESVAREVVEAADADTLTDGYVSQVAESVPWSALTQSAARHPYALAARVRREVAKSTGRPWSPIRDRAATLAAVSALAAEVVAAAATVPARETRPEVLALPIGGEVARSADDIVGSGREVECPPLLAARVARHAGTAREVVEVKLAGPIGGPSAGRMARESAATAARMAAGGWHSARMESDRKRAVVKSGRVNSAAWMTRPDVTAATVTRDGGESGAVRSADGPVFGFTVPATVARELARIESARQSVRMATTDTARVRTVDALAAREVARVLAGHRATAVRIVRATGRVAKSAGRPGREVALRATVAFTAADESALADATAAGGSRATVHRRRTAVLDIIEARHAAALAH